MSQNALHTPDKANVPDNFGLGLAGALTGGFALLPWVMQLAHRGGSAVYIYSAAAVEVQTGFKLPEMYSAPAMTGDAIKGSIALGVLSLLCFASRTTPGQALINRGRNLRIRLVRRVIQRYHRGGPDGPDPG